MNNACAARVGCAWRPVASATWAGKINGGGFDRHPAARPAPGQPTDPLPPPPFEPVSPAASAAKVKDLLTGLPLADDELAAVTADPPALRGLIDGWMGLPQFRAKMLEFFKKRLPADPARHHRPRRAAAPRQRRRQPRAEQRLHGHRASRRASPAPCCALVDEGRPFTETVTTTRFMLNVPLMVALAYMDAAPRNDTRPRRAGRLLAAGQVRRPQELQVHHGHRHSTRPPGWPRPSRSRRRIEPGPPELHEVDLHPARPGPLHALRRAGRGDGPAARSTAVFGALFGSRRRLPGRARGAARCSPTADWNTWRMVTIRPPRAGRGAHRLLGAAQAARPEHHRAGAGHAAGRLS